MVYDQEQTLIEKLIVPELLNSSIHSLTSTNDTVNILYESFGMGMNKYSVLKIKNNYVLQKDILELPIQPGNSWNLKPSSGKKFFLLYQVDPVVMDSVSINTIVIDSNFEVKTGKRFRFYVERQFEQFGNIFIDDSGNTYFMAYDQPLNYRLGSKIRLYKYSFDEEKIRRKDIYLKEKKPGNIHLSFPAGSAKILIHSFYYGFYSKNIDGLLRAVVDEQFESDVQLNYFTLSKEFKKSLNTAHSGISSQHLMNYLRIQHISFTGSESSTITATLETNEIRNFGPIESGVTAFKYPGSAESNTMLAFLQRDAMIRNQMRVGRTGFRSPQESSGALPTTSYFEAYNNLMSQKPDLFFMDKDTSGNYRKKSFFKKKIYDRQIVFSLKNKTEPDWKRWYETEEQSMMQILPLIPVETSTNIFSVYYRHNVQDQTELVVTRIDKNDGRLMDRILHIPPHISLLTTTPLIKLGENKIAILYRDNDLKRNGWAKIEW